MSYLYQGSAGSFVITFDEDCEELIAVIVARSTREVIGQYSTETREGFLTLSGSRPTYTGYLTAEQTRTLRHQGGYDIEVKAIIDDNEHPVGVAALFEGRRSTAGQIDPA